MDDLLREFLTETNESLDTVDVELVRFEQEPNNTEILGNIFRLVHTIKGTCGFLGLPRLQILAHAAETLMGKFRDGSMPVTGEAVTLVLSAIDRIKDILSELDKNEREPAGADDDLIGAFEAMVLRGAAPNPAVAKAAGTMACPGSGTAAASRRSVARRAGARVSRNAGARAGEAGRACQDCACQARPGQGRERGRGAPGGQDRAPIDPRQPRHARIPDDDGF